MLLGGGAGQLKGGRHIRYPEHTPLTNLDLTLLEKMERRWSASATAPAGLNCCPRFKSLRADEDEERGMAIAVRLLAGMCLTVLLSVAGVAAGDDLGLVKAVKDSDNAALRQLLARGNSTPAEREAALSWAARLDDLEAATLLIRAGADVNAANEYGATPLFLVCTNGSERIVEPLLKAGANPNTRFQSGETPLMTAARTGRIEAINALLRHGADVNVREGTPKGQTALMWRRPKGIPKLYSSSVRVAPTCAHDLSPVSRP